MTKSKIEKDTTIVCTIHATSADAALLMSLEQILRRKSTTYMSKIPCFNPASAQQRMSYLREYFMGNVTHAVWVSNETAIRIMERVYEWRSSFTYTKVRSGRDMSVASSRVLFRKVRQVDVVAAMMMGDA